MCVLKKKKKPYKQPQEVFNVVNKAACLIIFQDSVSEPGVGERQCTLVIEEAHTIHVPAVKAEEQEPKTPAASLQRQDSGPRNLRGILKKSRSASLETEPAPERSDDQSKDSEEKKQEDRAEKIEDETKVDGGIKVMQRANSSSSDAPRSPSLCTSEESEEMDSSLDGSMSSSFNQRYDGRLS